MNYVVVQTGGKQYKVQTGETLDVDRLAHDKGSKFTFDKVLLQVNEGTVSIGKPFLSGANVEAEVIDHVRGDKIRVSKFKAKSRYRRVIGFRADLTRIKIGKISEEKSNTKKAK